MEQQQQQEQRQEQRALSPWEAAKAFEAILAPPPPEQPSEEEELVEEESVEAAVDDVMEFDDEESLDEEVLKGPDLYRVIINGEEMEVPLSDLIAGFQRQSDYTQKTQALADQRRQVEAQVAELSGERAKYAAALPQLEEMLSQAFYPEPSPNQFKNQTDWLVAREQWRDHKAKIDAVKVERQRIQQEQYQAAQAQWQQLVHSENERLLKLLPEWADADKRQAEVGSLNGYLRQMGYSDQELGKIIDHRAIIIARKAQQYDDLMASGKRVKAKAQKGKKTLEPGTQEMRSKQPETKKRLERLKQTGSIDDAAAAFAALLG